MSGLAASATTDTTNASNISSGTLAAARLPAVPVNQSYSETLLGADVSMAANTDTAILSKSLTMPSSGGPFRVRVDYGLYLVVKANATWEAYVTDGTAVFASTQTGLALSASPGGFNGGGYSSATYANGANVTITLKARVNTIAGGGSFVKQVANGGSGTNSYLDVTVQQSN